MATDPLQAAAAHIDPVLFAEALAALDWTPHAELTELVAIAQSDNPRHKMGAMQILRSRIIESLELSGQIQLLQERIRSQLPGSQYTAERSRYLSSDAASSTHAHLKTLSTERLDVDTAPSTQTENTNDDDDTTVGTRAANSRSSRGIRQDDLANESSRAGRGPEQSDERRPTANPGAPPEPASGDTVAAGTGHPDDPAPATPSAEDPEAETVAEAGLPFKPRKPASQPAFGRPLGRRTPTKPTIGGGICGPPAAESD